MLAHLGCLGSAFECPRCSSSPLPSFESAKHAGLRRFRFAKGDIHTQVGREVGLDPRIPCALDERPSDAEARTHGFKSGHEKYMSAQRDGKMECNRDWLKGWELFEQENV